MPIRTSQRVVMSLPSLQSGHQLEEEEDVDLVTLIKSKLWNRSRTEDCLT